MEKTITFAPLPEDAAASLIGITKHRNLKSLICPVCAIASEVFWQEITWATPYEPDSTYYWLCRFSCCFSFSIWQATSKTFKQIHPYGSSNIDLPNSDIPVQAKEYYLEARDISSISPRSACALLRLSLEIILDKYPGRDINDKIGNLVAENKISAEIQKASDSIRVFGNHALHPGEIIIEDNQDKVEFLFTLINVITETLITIPNKINNLYTSLPQKAHDGIERRTTQKVIKK